MPTSVVWKLIMLYLQVVVSAVNVVSSGSSVCSELLACSFVCLDFPCWKMDLHFFSSNIGLVTSIEYGNFI